MMKCLTNVHAPAARHNEPHLLNYYPLFYEQGNAVDDRQVLRGKHAKTLAEGYGE
jgi:hypothetical protein